MTKSLLERVVIVTGAAGGIGESICRRVATLGAQVVAVDRDPELGEETVSGIREAGGLAHFVRADVSLQQDVTNYVEVALARFGRIDCLVNNAGIEGVVTPTVDYPVETFDNVLAVNVRSVFLGLKYALPHMIEQRSGVIVNIASVAGMIGHANYAGYVASKHAVVGLTRVAAAEVAQYDVRINAVCPGPTSTRMMASIEAQSGADPVAAHRETVAKIPAGHYAEPDDIARTVTFLLSDDASYIRGAIIAVDGGFTTAI